MSRGVRKHTFFPSDGKLSQRRHLSFSLGLHVRSLSCFISLLLTLYGQSCSDCPYIYSTYSTYSTVRLLGDTIKLSTCSLSLATVTVALRGCILCSQNVYFNKSKYSLSSPLCVHYLLLHVFYHLYRAFCVTGFFVFV